MSDLFRALTASALSWLDLAGIAVFAISGALAAARAGQTLVTFAFFASVTGIGGGTLRDLLIGAPVFWMHDSAWIAVCLIFAFAVWITPQRWWPADAVDWFDAVGLAAYAVYGAAKALSWNVPLLPSIIMGVVTACFGGIIRDTLAGVPSIIMRPEIYVTAAAVSSAVYVLLLTIGVPPLGAGAAGIALGFGLRALAITRGLALPAYRG